MEENETIVKLNLGNDRFAIIDREDEKAVKQYEWTLSSNGYVIRKGDQMSLARFLLQCDDTMRVKFRDKNKLNLTRVNLGHHHSYGYVPSYRIRKFLK